MKIVSTAIILGLTLLVVPLMTYWFGTPLNDSEWSLIKKLMMITGGVILYCFVVGEITKNNSQVDKLWSLIPIVYAIVITDHGDYNQRLIWMTGLVTFWGVRLTNNFAMKGAYSWKFWDGEEDYRWVILREKAEFKPGWKWTLFNLFFISTYQNILILMFTLPMVVALQNNHIPIGTWDYVIAILMGAFILFELAADVQQWQFQSTKWKLIKEGKPLPEPYAKGFLDSGLWSLSRHPNYFAEQSIWVCFYLFSVAASGQWINWSIAGCLLLILLFQGSAQFSEEISASKYPEYKNYQARVPKFIPGLKP